MVETKAPRALWTSSPSWSTRRMGQEDFQAIDRSRSWQVPADAAWKNPSRVDFSLRLRLRVGRQGSPGLVPPQPLDACRRQPRVPYPILMFFSLPLTHWSLYQDDDFPFLDYYAVDSTHAVFNSPILCIFTYPLNLFYVYFNLCLLLSFSYQ
jgi:hypothetical protein